MVLSKPKIHLQAIDSLQILQSSANQVRKGILDNLLERANQKKRMQDLGENLPPPVQQEMLIYSSTLLSWLSIQIFYI